MGLGCGPRVSRPQAEVFKNPADDERVVDEEDHAQIFHFLFNSSQQQVSFSWTKDYIKGIVVLLEAFPSRRNRGGPFQTEPDRNVPDSVFANKRWLRHCPKCKHERRDDNASRRSF
jgi:hypothetical protein